VPLAVVLPPDPYDFRVSPSSGNLPGDRVGIRHRDRRWQQPGGLSPAPYGYQR